MDDTPSRSELLAVTAKKYPSLRQQRDSFVGHVTKKFPNKFLYTGDVYLNNRQLAPLILSYSVSQADGIPGLVGKNVSGLIMCLTSKGIRASPIHGFWDEFNKTIKFAEFNPKPIQNSDCLDKISHNSVPDYSHSRRNLTYLSTDFKTPVFISGKVSATQLKPTTKVSKFLQDHRPFPFPSGMSFYVERQ